MSTLKGYIDRIIYQNPQNGYTVMSVEENGVNTTCVGSFPTIHAGEFMEFTGEFVLHPKFGQQFKAEKARVVMPEDLASIERYLGSGAIKGIGMVTARRIIEKFGEDTLRILDEEPERLAEIKGISRRKAQEIAANQEEKKDLRNVMIFLGDYGISNALAVKLYGMYGQDIYTIIRDNPYQLADDVMGIGFRKADEIARHAGINPGSDFRIKACMVHTLQRALENGDVYLPEHVLKSRVMQTLQPLTVDDICEVEESDLERCLEDLVIDSRLIIREPQSGETSEVQSREASDDYFQGMEIAESDGSAAEAKAAESGGVGAATKAAESGGVGAATKATESNGFASKVKAIESSDFAAKAKAAKIDGTEANIQEAAVEEFVAQAQVIESNKFEAEQRPSAPSRQVYYSQNFYTEQGIARMMMRLNLRSRLDEAVIDARISQVEEASQITLDEMQRSAVKAAAGSGVLIITGGPGTGKTTTINALIQYFAEDHRDILLAAPTGRAAKRMTEATGYEAKTIHRMLELSTELEDTSSGARFNRNEDCPLEADVVIVDEASMIDIFLMSALLRAIEPGTRLILVGDVDQLPSVGPGNVLRDLIKSACFPTVKLVKIFRQAEESEIVVNAHRINRGEQISLRTDSKDFIFLQRNTPQAVAGAVLTLIKDKLPKYVQADIREIQVLSPMKRGDLGVLRLNRFLQEAINPPADEKKELPVRDMIFREGDKVMHIKNNYDLQWELRTASGFAYETGTGIFNGDIGIIERINEHRQMLEVTFDDGKHVIYEFEQLEELTLAYATTIHKSQGSEYPAVILPLLSGPDVLMNRNILYTAVTRARKCVVIVGNPDVIGRMIHNTREQERYTGLKDRLLEAAAHPLR